MANQSASRATKFHSPLENAILGFIDSQGENTHGADFSELEMEFFAAGDALELEEELAF